MSRDSATSQASAKPQSCTSLSSFDKVYQEMRSHLEWQLNVEPSALKEFESTVCKDFKGLGPYLAHYTLPAPSSGPFAHPKPNTNNIPTAIPSFGLGAPPSPPSTTFPISPEKLLQRSSVGTYPAPVDPPLLPTPPSSHSNIPSPANSMFLIALLNYKGDSMRIVSSAGLNTM